MIFFVKCFHEIFTNLRCLASSCSPLSSALPEATTVPSGQLRRSPPPIHLGGQLRLHFLRLQRLNHAYRPYQHHQDRPYHVPDLRQPCQASPSYQQPYHGRLRRLWYSKARATALSVATAPPLRLRRLLSPHSLR